MSENWPVKRDYVEMFEIVIENIDPDGWDSTFYGSYNEDGEIGASYEQVKNYIDRNFEHAVNWIAELYHERHVPCGPLTLFTESQVRMLRDLAEMQPFCDAIRFCDWCGDVMLDGFTNGYSFYSCKGCFKQYSEYLYGELEECDEEQENGGYYLAYDEYSEQMVDVEIYWTEWI